MGDFVKIEYTGYDQSGNVFDSTQGKIAQQLHGKEGSMLIVLGTDYLVKGMEDALLGMKKGDEKEILLSPDKAFGSKDRRRVKVFSVEEFYRNKLDPYPGAVVQMETEMGSLNGIVKSVNSGRVTVDFNHPLADQQVKYKIKLIEVIEDSKAKIESLVSELGIEGGSVAFADGKAVITMKKGQADEELKKTRLAIAIKNTIKEVKGLDIKAE